MTGRVTLFISYAHEDEPWRRDLEKHLSALRGEGLVDDWHDRRIAAGTEWDREIHESLDTANIILLLISPDFMASRYIREVEVTRAMQHHEMSTARVIPVLVRPTDWKGAPFSKLQAIPSGPKPVSEWPDRDAAFADIAAHLRSVCRELSDVAGNPANPYAAATVGDWYEMEIMVDLQQTGETKLATGRVVLIEKDEERAIIRATIESTDLGNDEKTIEIPIDRPLEDSMGSVVGTVAEQIPPNATLSTRQTGAGKDKLFIGGTTYYTTWVSMEVEMRMGRDRVVQKGTRWLSSDVPLDGIVKTVMESPGATQTMIVTGHGRGDGSAPAPRKAQRSAGSGRPVQASSPQEPATLDRILVGRWTVTISQPFGPAMPAAFQFDGSGQFVAEMASPMVGRVTMQGQWTAVGNILTVQGVQNTMMGSMPYAAQVQFAAMSPSRLQGGTATGEQVVFVRS